MLPFGEDSGDIAWVLAATALVMLMTPALGFFYGGLVRQKNLISTIVQCFIVFAVVSLVWALWGYSLAFGPNVDGVVGNLSNVGLNGVGVAPNPLYSATIPALLYFAFQLKFAAITPALIIGAVAERIRFKTLLIFIVLWTTLIYAPLAHWVWGDGGWLRNLGVLDFAGGLVVHISAGLSAIAAALVVGRRRDDPALRKSARPNNVPFVILGAALLWFGWFGFNGGSALAANSVAVYAVINTNLAAAAGAVSWMVVDWVWKGKPSAVGMAIGAVAGLVGITPASGFVEPMAAILIGVGAGILANLVSNWRLRSRLDDSLDVFACHGMGAVWGVVATGLFATVAVNVAGASGLLYNGDPHLVLLQMFAVVVVAGFCFCGSYALLTVIGWFTPLRVTPEEEDAGLDLSVHGEEAYDGASPPAPNGARAG
ncbi:MAG: ammonium transporter [Thermoplasmata archaeon]